MKIDAIDRRIVEEVQAGLPLSPTPYADVAAGLGLREADLLGRLRAMRQAGIIRRIGIAPNHFALGLTANGMTVWDVDDEAVSDLGHEIGTMDFVTHCYRRPRALPVWPYNLFAMVHGADRAEVEEKRSLIAERLGAACRGWDILYSTRILKKAGLRIGRKGGD